MPDRFRIVKCVRQRLELAIGRNRLFSAPYQRLHLIIALRPRHDLQHGSDEPTLRHDVGQTHAQLRIEHTRETVPIKRV